MPPPPKPSASTASIRTQPDNHGTRRSPAEALPSVFMPAFGLDGRDLYPHLVCGYGYWLGRRVGHDGGSRGTWSPVPLKPIVLAL
jgi:hypothetical protein